MPFSSPSPVKLEVDPQPRPRRRLAAAAPHDAKGQPLAAPRSEASQRPAVSAGLCLDAQIADAFAKVHHLAHARLLAAQIDVLVDCGSAKERGQQAGRLGVAQKAPRQAG